MVWVWVSEESTYTSFGYGFEESTHTWFGYGFLRRVLARGFGTDF